MTIKTLTREAETHKLNNYDFAAVGIALPEATILHPSVAGHTDAMMETSPDCEAPFMLTHDGVLTDMHKFGNRYDILGVDKDNTAPGKNKILGAALEKQIKNGQDFETAFRSTVPYLRGAFSIIAKQDKDLFVATDSNGYGDMFVGELPSGGIVASSRLESVEELNANIILELEPGTLARIGAQAVSYTRWAFKL